MSLPSLSLETYMALARVLELDTERLLAIETRRTKISRERRRLEADVMSAAEAMPDERLREWLEIGAVLTRRAR